MTTSLQLSQMLTNLRHELGISERSEHGEGNRARLHYMLQSAQRELHEEHAWPFLRQRFSLTLNAGQRYYDPPSGIQIQNFETGGICVKWSGELYGVERGIDYLKHYSIFDSDADERSDPAERWDERYTGSATQIEIWPIPSATQTLYILGKRDLGAFVDDGDLSTLDGDLIVLWAAFKATTDDGESKKLSARFQTRLATVKARAAKKGIVGNFAGGDQQPVERLRAPTA